ncbi:MAG: YraN family protein [Holosporaceae bacterium]|jgi:putative endonuclease|nr:YraN family protein [Holosporaceae bacterium]
MNATEQKGYFGEFIAVCLLKFKGYRILARRYKTVCGEIDIVAQKNNVVAFIEVKSRKNMDKCYNAITAKQLQRIQRASGIFMNRRKNLEQNFMRYDVILVADWKLPVHITNLNCHEKL